MCLLWLWCCSQSNISLILGGSYFAVCSVALVQLISALDWKIWAVPCRGSCCFWQVLGCVLLSRAQQVLGSCILGRSPGLQHSSSWSTVSLRESAEGFGSCMCWAVNAFSEKTLSQNIHDIQRRCWFNQSTSASWAVFSEDWTFASQLAYCPENTWNCLDL